MPGAHGRGTLQPTMRLFISYRRDDSALAARLVHNELSALYGSDDVFMDVDDIGWGDDFVQAIDEHLERADVVVVMIGPAWADIVQQRLRGDDWVRHEVRRALELQAAGRVRVVPVHVGRVPWPPATLPPDLLPLRNRVVVPFEPRDLKRGIEDIVKAIEKRSVVSDLAREKLLRMARLLAVPLGLAVFMAGWVALLDRITVDTQVAGLTMALAAVGAAPPPPSGQVVLLGIDRRTEAQVGRPFDASWRAEHGRLVEQVAAAGARTLAFDITLAAPGDEAANARLEQALQAVQGRLPVVFAVSSALQGQPALQPRFAALVHTGVACVGRQAGAVRAAPLAVRAASAAADAAPRQALALAAWRGGRPTLPIDEDDRVLQAQADGPAPGLNTSFYALETVRTPHPECSVIAPGDRAALQTIDPNHLPLWREAPRRIPYEAVLAGDAAALQALKGKAVLVGLMRAPDEDVHNVPGSTRWGVELTAQQLDDLAAGRAVTRLDALAEALLTALATAAGVALAVRLSARGRGARAAVLVAAGLALALGSAALYRMEGLLLSWHYLWLAAALGCMLTTAWLRKGR